MKFDVLSYVKNSTHGKVIGVAGLIVIFGGSYYLIENIGSNNVEKKLGTIEMKKIEGQDGTTLINKEKQLELYIKDEKDRSKSQDFFIKNAYYISDEDKRNLDGKTLNTKEFELTTIEEKIIELESIEEAKKELEIEKDKVDENKVSEEVKKIEKELENIKEKNELTEIENPKKIEKNADEDIFNVKPDLAMMEPKDKVKYKNDKLVFLANMVAIKPELSSVKNVTKILPEINATNIQTNNLSSINILPGSSFYGVLQNNLNSLSTANVAIITFTSPQLKNYKAIGTTQVDANGEGMSIIINQIVDPQGNRIAVSAFAIETDKLSSVMADETNSQTLKKIGLTSASILLNAFGDAKNAVQNSGQTVTTTEFSQTTSIPVQDFDEVFAGNIATNTGTKIDEYLVNELQKTQNEVKINSGKNLIVIFH